MIEPMDWEEVNMNIGNPVYDKFEEKWRVLDGCMRREKDFYISFSDKNSWFDFKIRKIYLKKV